ncbi:Outer membrane protein TolC [Parelusimicrobium proximum]|uniref:TolC family protein n=1 Tax=Parelusimicrobium proximum TaxID=3228953 RepID=UPI003D18218E
MRKLVLICAAFALSLTAFAQKSGPDTFAGKEKGSKTGRNITLTDAVNIALQDNASVLRAAKQKEIYDLMVSQYRSYLYPSISLSGSYTRALEKGAIFMGGSKIEMGMNNTFSAGADASWLLYSGGKVKAGLNMAKMWKSTGVYEYQNVKNLARKNVEDTAYSVMISAAYINVQREYLEIAKEHLAETEKKYKQGLASSLEVLTQKVAVGNIEPTVISAENLYEVNRLNLKRLLSIDPEVDIDLVWTREDLIVPEVISLEEMYKLAEQNSPDLILSKLNVDIAKEQVVIERGGHLPSITAFADRYYNGSTESGFPGTNEYYWASNVGVRLSLPLFEGFRVKSLVDQKKAAYDQAVISYQDKIKEVRINVKTAWLNFNEANLRLKASEGVVVQSRENSEAMMKRFKAGLASRLEVDDAALDLNEAELQYLQARSDALAALTNLRYYTGGEVVK